MEALFIIALVVGIGLPALLLALVFGLNARDHRGPAKDSVWVAEIWLEWPVCRGSTMWRNGFRSKTLAYLVMRLRAWELDMALPRFCRSTDYLGRPCLERYEYGILYGVRKLSPQEAAHGVQRVWTTRLPGHQGHAGEHRDSHPLFADAEVQAAAAGFKV